MAKTFGYLEHPGNGLPAATNTKYVSKFTATDSFSATKGVTCTSASGSGTGSVRMVVYADSAGAPGALLGVSDDRSLTAPAVGEYVFNFSTPVSIVAGTSYWIGIHASTSSVFQIEALIFGSNCRSSVDTFSDGAANPFGTPTSVNWQMVTWLSDGGGLQARASQVVVETLRLPTAPNARASQVALETLRAALTTGKASQVVLEILRVNGAETPLAGAARPVVFICT